MTKNMGMSNAERQKKWRKDQEAGLLTLRVKIEHATVSEAMRRAGFLPDDKIDNRKALSLIAAEILEAWALRVTSQDDLDRQ